MKKHFLLLVIFAIAAQQFVSARNWLAKKERYFPLKEILQNNSKMSLADMKDTLAFEMKKNAQLQIQLSNSQVNINRIATQLKIPVLANATGNGASDAQITALNNSISTLKMYGFIALLLVAGLSFRLFLDMRRKLQTSMEIADAQLSLTKRDLERYIYQLEKDAIQIDNRLVQVLHEQLSIIKEENAKKNLENPLAQYINPTDHRLPIKVGEEIHRMKKRIENMDKEIKGLGALVNSINRLSEELTGSGYEMEELIGKKYVDGMKMEARFVDNPDIPPGEERITDVLRPEIKYKGEVIQVAKVEVGKSY